MKKAILFVATLMASTAAMADQAATITCTGKNVILTSKSPYMGENSDAAQTLYTLKSVDNQNESVATAFFLDVDENADVDKYGMVYSYGKNSKGGSFTLKTKFWQDVGDGTVIDEATTGTLTYSHGVLKGKDEAVNCVKK